MGIIVPCLPIKFMDMAVLELVVVVVNILIVLTQVDPRKTLRNLMRSGRVSIAIIYLLDVIPQLLIQYQVITVMELADMHRLIATMVVLHISTLPIPHYVRLLQPDPLLDEFMIIGYLRYLDLATFLTNLLDAKM
ncbi:hypothetical protein PHET_11354 [Paragonimus heterotremus]|uniref:Uncharacterized protein n=1 Tax=Paragonimus heterotremus TaxID=100268 RepID=A0A8J4SQA6_9TREM|nr:hypothetical protein PHET_11354 [Paragonimus heterotremus]